MYLYLTFAFVLYCSYFCDCRRLDNGNEIPSSYGCKVGKTEYKLGEQWSTPGECLQYTCLKEGNIGAVTCPSIYIPEETGCRETEIDKTKLYPDCCPKVVCPQDPVRLFGGKQ